MPYPEGNPIIPEGINASEENPLKEFATLVIGVAAALTIFVICTSMLVSFLAPKMPFAWEQKASPAINEYLEFAADSGEPPGSTELTELATALLQTSLTIPVAGKLPQESVPATAFGFYLLPIDLPNAFATLGAHVAVTEGLLQHVTSENGLAMVVAHEIAHVQLRHPIEASGRGIIVQLALLGIVGSSGSNLLGGVLTTGSSIPLLSYNRDMELAADQRALDILNAHYGHVLGADEFFLAMETDDSMEEWLEFTQTHPSTEKRLKFIRAAISEAGDGVELTPIADTLRREP